MLDVTLIYKELESKDDFKDIPILDLMKIIVAVIEAVLDDEVILTIKGDEC